MEEETRLCSLCDSLVPLGTGSTSKKHHPDYQSLAISSRNCPLCKVIHDNWSLMHASDVDPKPTDEQMQQLFESIKIAIFVPETFMGKKPGVWYGTIKVFMQQDDLPMVNEFSIYLYVGNAHGVAPPLLQGQSSSVDQKIAKIKYWLNDCLECHPNCVNPIRTVLPKRLVYIGSEDENELPRVIETKSPPNPDLRYIVLSYPWEGDLPLEASRANIKDLRQGIKGDMVPPAFLDAMKIARGLGVSYIWMDALCVLRNDIWEWEKEMYRLRDILSGGLFTIETTDAANNTEGCFFPSALHSGRTKPPQVFSAKSSKGNTPFRFRIDSGNVRHATQVCYHRRRGWSIPVKLLSRRIVHCMRSGVHWQCVCSYRTESGADIPTIDNRPLTGLHNVNGEPVTEPDNRIWLRWIEEYSARFFVIWTDRVVALAGLVKHYLRLTGDKPLLGLWIGNVIEGLHWRRQLNSQDHPGACALTNMPSWTWLSCPAPVSYRDYEGSRQHLCSLLNWDIKWEGIAWTSEVESAQLVLRGCVVSLTLSSRAGSMGYFHFRSRTAANLPGGPPASMWDLEGQFDSVLPRAWGQYMCIFLCMKRAVNLVKETFLILEYLGKDLDFKRIGIGCLSSVEQRFRPENISEITLL